MPVSKVPPAHEHAGLVGDVSDCGDPGPVLLSRQHRLQRLPGFLAETAGAHEPPCRWNARTDDIRQGGRGYQHDFRGAAGRAQRLDADGAMCRYRFGQRPRQGMA